MRILKFGGASVNDANGVKNIATIIQRFSEPTVVVISAMGKMTNAFELLVKSYFDTDHKSIDKAFDHIKTYHHKLVETLFEVDNTHIIEPLLKKLKNKLQTDASLNYDFEYDQIVPYGELLSTHIVSYYLNSIGTTNEWVDIRKVLRTDNCFRNAEVNWELTQKMMLDKFTFNGSNRYLTQGFIGACENNLTTTLGREGSDYTGAIIAYALDANDLSIWKDVPGVLNADPRWYTKAHKIDELSYWEAIELSYYGAQVIHPKTIKPLQNKQIPLLVKSFINPDDEGTTINATEQVQKLDPIFVLKKNQTLLSISPKDFSFILEQNLSDIFQVISKHRIKINLMQSSALNFSVCVDHNESINNIINELSTDFDVRYNEGMELVTIRHYTDEAIDEIIFNKTVIDSQVSRKTARYVVKKSNWNFNR